MGKYFATDVFESYSAGTETKPHMNQDVVRLMKSEYGIDIKVSQRSKLLEDIPPVDVVITMGFNVTSPTLPCKCREDWGLDDPTGKSDDEFKKVKSLIVQNILLQKFVYE
ncbi:MAG: arsenate reductase ArsC [Sphaerochaetaceae bacterium]|nr:arsenate reductase ArsC [Sphaerochaetaceae bacterium]